MARKNTAIDFIFQIFENFGCRGSGTISAGTIQSRTHIEILFDHVRELFELLPFQTGRKVSGEGIAFADFFFVRRRHPGVKLCTDIASTRLQEFAQRPEALLLGGHGIIDRIGWDDAKLLENTLGAELRGNRLDTAVRAGERLVPIELFFRIDNDDKTRPRRGGKSDDVCAARRQHRVSFMTGHCPF
ncbi:MAG TPA: hypothetical protein VHD95_03830 [Rhizomicrobium sp.]|nr:hypothetical protein [Rhizomicrobium sp.]